jgi:transmembrane protein
MPSSLARLIDTSWFAVLARVVLTSAFWGSGLAKLIDFPGGVAEMALYGLEPAVAFNVACIVTQIGGSFLVILNRHVWLGCGALAVFTALTIPLVHHFWTMRDPQEALMHFFFVAEHVSLIGGLMVMSILSRRPRPAAAAAPVANLVPAE